jgi:glycosyltransferase involved in cell wall biosynthesis
VKIHGSDVRLVGDHTGRHQGTAEALRLADGVIAVSRDLADRAIELGAKSDWTSVIIDGVDRDLFSPGDMISARQHLGLRAGARHLLFVGNLHPVKGLDILVEACALLHERFGDWELHLVGEGEMREQLVQQVNRGGLSERVRFHGSQSHSDLPQWFRAASLFVLPSRSEGTPNVLLEAASCGTPFVASAVGGIPAISHLGRSILVPPVDPRALAEAIIEGIQQPPAQPAEGPRDRREAVAEMAEFLDSVRQRAAGQSRFARPNVAVRFPPESSV